MNEVIREMQDVLGMDSKNNSQIWALVETDEVGAVDVAGRAEQELHGGDGGYDLHAEREGTGQEI